MQPQETFDTAVSHLFDQGKRATGDYGPCLYRAPCGAKCVVGALINDDEYTPDMENMDVLQLVRNDLLPARLLPEADLLRRLQDTHDCGESWTDSGLSAIGLKELRRIAKHFKLSTSVLDHRATVAAVEQQSWR